MSVEVKSYVNYGYSDVRNLLFDIARWLEKECGWVIEHEFPNAVDKFTAQSDYSFLAKPLGDATNLFEREEIALKMSTETMHHADGYSYRNINVQVTPMMQCDSENGNVIEDSRGVTSGNLGPEDEYEYVENNMPKRVESGAGAFFDTSVVKGRLKAHPVSWRGAVTDYGIFLCVWLEGDEHRDPPTQSWFVVQRPVDQSSGEPLRDPEPVGSRNPIFALYGISNEVNQRTPQRQQAFETYANSNNVPISDATQNGAICVKRFVVREKDVNAPSRQLDAWRNGRDANAIVNLRQQQARIEMRDIGVASVEKAGSRYAILFPSRLNTARFRFKSEMDMVAFTSADVISSGLPVNVHVYGETSQDTGEKLYRRYVAIQPTGPYNTQLIMLHLVETGIPESVIQSKGKK
ncbi:hypothetical protein [Pseudoalteromonas umbrosa]|uniref:hypothetical protein n=1 Tax=Pseudoalteromonas umbrosa TaxID=3048489 RepID=UPI0024C30B88|nr:hypothetical protein [Pseudoalteromonas sp. B95]MDK1290195.1 hypothetical protein [Pseudoalteromonas sp. B95]